MTAVSVFELKISMVWIKPKGRKSGSKSEGSENSKVGRFVTSKLADEGGKKLMLEVLLLEELSEVVMNESGVSEPLSELVKSDRSWEVKVRSPPSRKPGWTG
jgi:hypothetical protein